MTKYALLLGGDDPDKRSDNAEFAAKMFQPFAIWLNSIRDSGRYVDSRRLRSQTGVRLTVRGGQVVEGPFMETKEAVGGIIVVEAASLEDAVAIARECPTLHLQRGFVEVSVIEEVRIPGAA
jgi:hypothetical protein